MEALETPELLRHQFTQGTTPVTTVKKNPIKIPFSALLLRFWGGYY